MPNPVAAGVVVAVGAGMLLRKLRGEEEEESENSADSSSEDSFSVPSTYDQTEESEDDGNSAPGEHSNQDRYSADVDESYIAHEQAGQRDAPVELGEVYEIFIDDETRHHSGRRDLTGKFEGFRIFVKDPPEHVGVDDIVTVKITSFNRGGTSADAKVVGE